MKASIDEHGILTIKSESPLEAFALRCWYEKIVKAIPDNMLLVFLTSAETECVCEAQK